MSTVVCQCNGKRERECVSAHTVYMQSGQLNVNQAANQTSLKAPFYLIESTFIPVSLAGEN